MAACLTMVGVVGAIAVGCQSEQQIGQECLKNDDCESKRCIQYVCVDPDAGKVTPLDTGSATETATEAATEAATDAPADVPPDTTSASDAPKSDASDSD